tara:strand:+ start:2189 stop:2404 length:216 start_codon:yes stop_codon:yes gene_type:complete
LDRESRIAAAKARIKELELLIDAWTPKAPEPEEPQTMQGLKISKEDLDALHKITDAELELFYNTVNLNKIK